MLLIKAFIGQKAEEQAFLSNFANKRYSPEKLFFDLNILDRIRSHPMVEWKIRK